MTNRLLDRMTGLGALSGLGAAALLFAASQSFAESVADFYKGKTVTVYVGFAPGGGYDLHARLLAQFMPSHMPGKPTFIVRNMPGAGGLLLANSMYNSGAADGTVFGTFDRSVPLAPLMEPDNAHFDSRRFTWIGSTSSDVATCLAWHSAPVKNFDDLLQQQLVVAGTGAGGDSTTYPLLLNEVLGTKFKVVNGYPGSSEVSLALERGEVQGFCSYSWSTLASVHPDWLTEKKVNVLVQFGFDKPPNHLGVPLAIDMAKSAAGRKAIALLVTPTLFSRPFAAPPGIPADRAAALRSAFDATLKDKDYLAKAAESRLEISPVAASRIEDALAQAYQTDPDVLKQVKGVFK